MILAILQARVSSTRLPGKVLKHILGREMLLRQIERILRSKAIDHVLVATSTAPSDDPIEQLCANNYISCYRGSLVDVLDRYYQAAKIYNTDYLVRLTGDCPLCDPALIDQVIAYHISGDFDYTSNTIETTFPDGLDVEIFSLSCLEEAWVKSALPSEREHVTPYIYNMPKRFKIGSFKNDVDLSYLRWTVDEPEDFMLVTKIYEALYPCNNSFAVKDILLFLNNNPELKTFNVFYRRNEGYLKSLKNDVKKG